MELDRIPLWRGDGVSIKQLAEDFASYLYLPRLVRSSVLIGAIRDGLKLITWMDDSFTYADSFDETAKRYRGLRYGQPMALSEDNLSGLLVKSDVAVNQQNAEVPPTPTPVTKPLQGAEDRGTYGSSGGDVTTGTGTVVVPGNGTGVIIQPVVEQPPKSFYGSVTLDPTRVGRDAGRIADEVISHLAGLIGSKVTVTLEIEADIPSGAPEHVVRVVTEYSRTLKFTSQGFEKE